MQYQKGSNRKTFQRPTSHEKEMVFHIDARMAGLIIGKRGKQIRSLGQRSGAFINISDSHKSELKTVKIRGTESAKENATILINELIAAYKSDTNYQELEEVSDLSNMHEKKLIKLPAIVKNVYKEHSEVSKWSDKEVEDFRFSKNNIMVKYSNEDNTKPIPKPIMAFSHAFKDYPEILKEIEKQKFETPSPVQCQAWPIIMSGHDLIAIAQSGTGKTLAFLLPAFIHIVSQLTPRSQRKKPSVLVLAPTRGLVLQIENEVKKFNFEGIKSMSMYDSSNFKTQIDCLKNCPEIVIATPSCLNDFVIQGLIDLSDVTFLILDEADIMLKTNLELEVRKLVLMLRIDRQTVLISETCLPEDEVKLYTKDPIQVMVKTLELTSLNTIKQYIHIMEKEEKKNWLFNFLNNCSKDDKVIVFLNNRVAVDKLSVHLVLKGYKVVSMNSINVRENALKMFHTDEKSILLATDLACRGIDINNITVVINYDMTNNIGEYVHRVSRIGRAGIPGLAITLMTRLDWSQAETLVEVMKNSGQDIPLELEEMAERFQAKQKKEKAEQVVQINNV